MHLKRSFLVCCYWIHNFFHNIAELNDKAFAIIILIIIIIISLMSKIAFFKFINSNVNYLKLCFLLI